jgi:undecaprenyl pyrophosphate phosphatase UppP
MKHKIKHKMLRRIIYLATVLLSTTRAHAQVQAPELPISGQKVSLTKLIDMINQVAEFLVQVGPVIAVIFLIWGGITYMAAGANEERAQQAKTRIKNAIIGIIIIFGIGVILQTISSFIGGSLQ